MSVIQILPVVSLFVCVFVCLFVCGFVCLFVCVVKKAILASRRRIEDKSLAYISSLHEDGLFFPVNPVTWFFHCKL